jgi:hypothetical protein
MTSPQQYPGPIKSVAIFPPVVISACRLEAHGYPATANLQSSMDDRRTLHCSTRGEEEDPERWDGMS